MSTNCLVKKLKASVQNENLSKLGIVQFGFTTQNGLAKFSLNVSTRVNIVHGTIGGNTYIDYTAGQYNYLSNYGAISIDEGYENAYVELPKYNITKLNLVKQSSDSYIPTLDMDELLYSPIIEISGIGCNATLNETVLENLEVFALIKSNFSNTVDITNLGRSKKLTQINLVGNPGGFVGCWDNVGFCNLQGNVTFGGSTTTVHMEIFIKNNISENRTSGSLNFPYLGGINAYFGGNRLKNAETNTFTWEPDVTAGRTKITYNNGTTEISEIIDNSTGEIVI